MAMKNPAHRLVIYLPSLLDAQWHQHVDGNRLAPGLRKLLSRSSVQDDDIGLSLSHRAALWQIDSTDEIPFALMRQHDDQKQDSNHPCLMCADPVYVQADRDQLLLLEHAKLQVTEQEAEQILASLNQHFVDDGICFAMQSPMQWLLWHTDHELVTTPLQDVIGKPVTGELPQGKQARQWRNWLNEIQMLLHQHPVNQQREVEGKLPVNSLWLWGNSQPDVTLTTHWSAIISNHEVDQSFAAYINKSTDMNLIEKALEQGEVLWIDTRLLDAMQQRDLPGWQTALQDIESSMLTASKLLSSGQCQAIHFIPGNGKRYVLTRKQAGKWYKRTRTFQQLVHVA